eukprot:TRINITY_DN4121_c0_g1_i1.p1 TRINITY_DN4121_c0_g1~~TRINITY_DN4121_c0_g1_i1.p1  ORF type:complete len:404 (-),score=158.39 TRINITY_DN4121_c0_g1_i1:89-1300(-)
MSTADEVLELKNKGNDAFRNRDYASAIDYFTQGISLDPQNHVLYSNRSGSFVGATKYKEALDDADRVILIKPDWPKGYSRKATALRFMGRLREAQLTLEQGLAATGNDSKLVSDMAEVQREIEKQQAENPYGEAAKLFTPDNVKKLANHRVTSQFFMDASFVGIIDELLKKPDNLSLYSEDERIQACLMALMTGMDDRMFRDTSSSSSTSSSSTKKNKKEKEVEVEIPDEELTPEELEQRNKKREADALKAEGNQFYKEKDFNAAIDKYNAASKVLPDEITYYTNRAACYFEMKDYDKCIEECKEGIEIGKNVFAPFEKIAKAYARIGNAYVAQEMYEEAIEAYNSSVTEHRDRKVVKKLAEITRLKTKLDAEAYIDLDKAEEARSQGNTFFTQAKYPEAIEA